MFKVDGVTISEDEKSAEFIIHVKGEYDYRYLSPNLRDTIVAMIRRITRNKGHDVLFYRVVSIVLSDCGKAKHQVEDVHYSQERGATRHFQTS